MNRANTINIIITASFLVSTLLFGGCLGKSEGQSAPDASAIKVGKPPDTEKTSPTASNCNKITKMGKCEKGVAITCNLTRNELVQRDCDALGKDCVWDVTRGASCATIEKKDDLDQDTTCTGDKMDAKGVCIDGEAIYCDTKTDTITVWKCKSTQTCELTKCRQGCCDKNPDETPPETPEECGDFTFEGECVGNVAKWCGSDNELKVEDCSDFDQRCIEDVCAVGAYCCDENADKECSDMGAEGICSPDKTKMIYCDGDSSEDIITENCEDDDLECQVDGPCGSGAYCCDKATSDNKCLEVGSKGKCDGDTLIFCLGTEDKDSSSRTAPSTA